MLVRVACASTSTFLPSESRPPPSDVKAARLMAVRFSVATVNLEFGEDGARARRSSATRGSSDLRGPARDSRKAGARNRDGLEWFEGSKVRRFEGSKGSKVGWFEGFEAFEALEARGFGESENATVALALLESAVKIPSNDQKTLRGSNEPENPRTWNPHPSNPSNPRTPEPTVKKKTGARPGEEASPVCSRDVRPNGSKAGEPWTRSRCRTTDPDDDASGGRRREPRSRRV